MSASSKFDLSSGSPDRPLYASGNRGSFGASSLDRSGSFRENMENPLLSSLPSMSRSSSSATQGDVLNFFQCVRIDPKSMVVEHKLNRPAEFKRLASSAVSNPLEDTLPASSKGKQLSTPSLEDLRRLKSGVRESGTKSRERVKIFNDCLSVINKCFPTIPSRKRSRPDALSNDRSNTLLSIDRSTSGMGIGKMGSQNHAGTSGFVLEQLKSDERTKNPIPSKRTRTSMMDVRTNNSTRPSVIMDKDRNIVRPSNSSAITGDNRSLSVAVDGWENSKMKKKRTGIKLDAAANSMMTKPVDGYREPKQGMHLRLPTEARSRSIDAHGFRSGTNNGGHGVGKAEATPQTSSGMRSSVSRTDSDNTSVLNEKRECPIGQEKERVNLKAVNKVNSQEDFSSGSPTSGRKLNANGRASRPGSIGGVSKLSHVVQRPTPSNDWEVSNCTSKIPGGLRANSRKRTSSARSSSPVANWVQRPQKTSRTARRTNLLPIVPGNDDNPAVETSDMMAEKRFFLNSPQQAKTKSYTSSPAALSESEESGATEIKSRDKNKKCDDIDEKSGQNIQKMSTLLLPPQKNKTLNRDGHGDANRRQGRTGRGFSSSRPLLPLSVEKLGDVGTTKQIRSSKLGHGKTESRVGRPPTRKLADRKAYTRQKHITISAGADFIVGSDDGLEELLAATNAVTNTDQVLASPFWKMTEPLFRFISDVDLSYLKDQVNPALAVDMQAPAALDAGSCTLVPNGCGSNDFRREGIEARSVVLSPEDLAPGAKSLNEISLYQRLIAALIPEEGHQGIAFSGKEDFKYDVYGSRFDMEKDMDSDTLCSQISPSCDPLVYPISNGYDVNSNGKSLYEMEHNIAPIPSYEQLQFGLHTDQLIPGTVSSEYQYCNLSINEKLLMEIHRIGIYPDLVSGEEEISGDINRLDEKYHEQASRKKSFLGKLLNSASEAKELQEKEFEGRALEKLVEMAYKKYMSCWGPSAHGMKSASGKMAKQAALAFVKRTTERYQEFKMTGKSCFDDPLYRDMFVSGVSRLIDGEPFNSSTDNDSSKLQFGISGCSMEVRTPAPVGIQQSPTSTNHDTYSSEAFPSANLGSEQIIGNEDNWNRVKRRELSLDDVGGTSSRAPDVRPHGLSGPLLCSAKGKRSERDRDGKGNSREVLARSETAKIGRPLSTSVKGERKSKTKLKQKTAYLSASVNSPVGKKVDQVKGVFSPSLKSNDIAKDRVDSSVDMLEEPIDLSGLQLPGIDDLGVPNDLGGQGEDIGSWLNIEDDVLHDHDNDDFIGGLGIPMDDLSDLNMMV